MSKIEDNYYRDLKDEIEESKHSIENSYMGINNEEISSLQEIIIFLTFVLSIYPLLYLSERIVLIFTLEPYFELVLFGLFMLLLSLTITHKKRKIFSRLKEFLDSLKTNAAIYDNLRKEKIELRKSSYEKYFNSKRKNK